IFAPRTRRGTAEETKTPTPCCANTFLKAATYQSSRPTTSTTSLPSSPPGPEKHWAGKNPPKSSTNYSQTRLNHPLLHPPHETTAENGRFCVCSRAQELGQHGCEFAARH